MEALYPDDPSTIGPYRLLARLGEGGMGRVFLGRSPSGRMVAVKVVQSELAREPHFRQRFRAEIAAVGRVSGMWTAPVLDYDVESARPWVATGYVPGPPLREVIGTLHGPLPEHSVWALAYGLASALLTVHRAGLIHRDLKPSNVMVTLEGPKVIDFGIARSVDASVVTRTGNTVGSPGYMPPEQIRGEPLTGAADVFAMGAVLAYASTGTSAFAWDGAPAHTVMYRVLNDVPHLGPQDGRLTGELRTLVLRCLAKDAGERPSLAGVQAQAQQRADPDQWLPPELTVRLGQVAATLLAFDGPEADRPSSSWGPRPPSAWDPRPSWTAAPAAPPVLAAPPVPAVFPGRSGPPGSLAHRDVVTLIPGDDPPPPAAVPAALATPPPPWSPGHTPASAARWPSPRRRSRGRETLAILSGALALAATAWLVVVNVGGDEGPPRAAGSGLDRTGSPHSRLGTESVGKDTALTDLVPPDVRAAGGITVHTSSAHAPVNFEEDGEPTGFEVDLVQAIGERLGVTVTVESAGSESSAAAEAAVRQGRDSASHIAVGNFVDNAAERREKGVDLVRHFADGWAVMSQYPKQFSGDLDQLCGMRITLWTDTPQEQAVREHTADCREPARIVPANGKDEMAEAIEAGEADAAVLVYTEAKYYAEQKNPGAGLGVSYDASGGARGIAVPSGQDELSTAVYQALNALMEDGTYRDLLLRWHMPGAALDGPDLSRAE